MREKIIKEFEEFKKLIRSVPSVITALFIVSVFSMNLLANKSIDIPFEWLALDCGIVVSWFAFLAMDIITKYFGPKAATELSVFAILLNLVFSLILFAVSKIPGMWGESFVPGSEETINTALDNTVGGTWYVVLGSTLAFLASSVINNFSNWGIGKIFKKNPDGFGAYISRSYISTAIGQFEDNLILALTVSYFFFGWSPLQCFTCALTGMVAELLCEAVFSYFGFAVCRKWKKDGVGEEYLTYKTQGAEAC